MSVHMCIHCECALHRCECSINERRKRIGLPPLLSCAMYTAADGELSITEYATKYAGIKEVSMKLTFN